MTYRDDDEVPSAVTVEPVDGGVVTAEDWRMIPIGTALAEVGSRRTVRVAGGALTSLTSDLSAAPKRPHADATDSSERMDLFRDRLIDVYRRGVRASLPAEKTIEVIAAHFDVNPGTVVRWIAELRDKGRGPLGTHAEEIASFKAQRQAMSDLRGGRRRKGATTAMLKATIAESIRHSYLGRSVAPEEIERSIATAIAHATREGNPK